MDINTFLNQYRKEVLPHTENFYKFYKAKADIIGKIPSDILAKLFKLHPKGKMHRGALVVLAYELAGGKDREEAVKASIAWELYATSILVADDIIDRDETRRGIPTIHKEWESYFKQQNPEHFGQSMGIITAIIGFHLAPLALNQSDFSFETKQKALNFLFESAIETGYGEALDISSSFQNLSDKQNSSALIHKYKTVNYSAVSPLLFGVTLADCKNKKLTRNLVSYGENLGKIFQIQDDILGTFGEPDKMGKSNESDLKEGRWTILVETLHKQAKVADRKTLLTTLTKKKRNLKDVEKIKKLMQKYDILTKAQVKAQAYFYKGLEIIPEITDDQDHRDTLQNLIEFMIKREK